MGALIDLTGQKFGRLTVINRAKNHTQKNGSVKTQWLCECDCGNRVVVQGVNLKNGHVKSCGCYQKDNPSHYKHGKRNEWSYKVWKHIKQRCFDKNCKRYKDYGGRGITVCDRWKNSFEAFYEDVSKLPNFGKEGYTLDRIDNDGNYELLNCRWADNRTQGNNKRNNLQITFNNKTQTLTQWANELNLNYKKLWSRLYQLNWSIEKAFKTP